MIKKLLVMFVLVLALGGCSKVLTPATSTLYEGELDGAYVSSTDVLAEVLEVRDCMGLTDRPFPLPKIRAMSGGNGVQCGDFVARGCYVPGTIIVPNETSYDVIAHEAVHHYLLLETGDADAAHKSPWFLKCGGEIKTD